MPSIDSLQRYWCANVDFTMLWVRSTIQSIVLSSEFFLSLIYSLKCSYSTHACKSYLNPQAKQN